MKLRPGLVFLFAALIGFVASPAEAKEKKTKFKPKPIEFPTTVVESVDAQSITVSTGNVSKAYTITQFTEVLVNGQRAKATDLKAGMTVAVTLGLDPTKASRIDAGPPPPSKKR